MSYLGSFDYCPKVNKKTVKFLEKVITKESLILETGTGNSTIWFALRAKRVVSFENRRKWHKEVGKHLMKNNIENVKVYFDSEYDSKNLDRILNKEDSIQCDIVFHDGPNPLERRLLLAKRIVRYVKLGGYLVIDDTNEKKRYKSAIDYLDRLGWEKIVLKGKEKWGAMKESTIYRRPEEMRE